MRGRSNQIIQTNCVGVTDEVKHDPITKGFLMQSIETTVYFWYILVAEDLCT